MVLKLYTAKNLEHSQLTVGKEHLTQGNRKKTNLLFSLTSIFEMPLKLFEFQEQFMIGTFYYIKKIEVEN